MKNPQFAGIFVLFALIYWISCEVIDPQEQTADVLRRDDKIFIRDRTGKEWDVTHAVNTYGFVPDRFQFGLGPFAIRPILDPGMISPGEDGYPSNPQATFEVIGVNIGGESRAYPINVMVRHEIADEKFGNQYVAVAY